MKMTMTALLLVLAMIPVHAQSEAPATPIHDYTFEDESDTSLGAGVAYSLTHRVALGASLSVADDAIGAGVGMRLYFQIREMSGNQRKIQGKEMPLATVWRFLDTGCHDADFNMAVDEALLQSHEAGQSPPTLRVYTWSSPTLSLGYAQNADKEIDVAACRQHGVTLVRRPTGGRAVLHDQEATYSVVMSLRLANREASITEHYHRIGLALAAALRHAGLAVRLERPSVLAAAPRSASPACFAALSRYELSATGRKLVGSAQKRGRRSLLQHGSIPLSMDRQRLFACLRVPADRRAQLLREAYASMVAVNEVAPAPLDAAALHRALRQGFADCLTDGAELSDGDLSPAERRLAEELRRTKYATDAWNLGGPAAWRQRQAASLAE